MSVSLSYWESDIRITNISQSLLHKMAENRWYEEIMSLSPYVYVYGFSKPTNRDLPDECWWEVAPWRWAALWAARCMFWCCWWNWPRCAFRCTFSWWRRWKPSKSNSGIWKSSNALPKWNVEPLGKCAPLLPLKKNISLSSSSKKPFERKMSWKFALWAELSNDPSPNWSYCLRFSLSLRTS